MNWWESWQLRLSQENTEGLLSSSCYSSELNIDYCCYPLCYYHCKDIHYIIMSWPAVCLYACVLIIFDSNTCLVVDDKKSFMKSSNPQSPCSVSISETRSDVILMASPLSTICELDIKRDCTIDFDNVTWQPFISFPKISCIHRLTYYKLTFAGCCIMSIFLTKLAFLHFTRHWRKK